MASSDVHDDWPEVCASRSLDGKVGLVTGGGSSGDLPGTGAAIAYTLALCGAKIAIVERDEERAENTRRRILAKGGSAEIVLGDIRTFAECERIVDEVVGLGGRLDILVNNVGVNPDKVREQSDRGEIWEHTLAVNLSAPRHLIVLAAQHMSGMDDASIVNIVSMAALRASSSLAYGASKGGLVALTQSAAQMYGLQGIRVNAVAPGFVDTPVAGSRLDELRSNGMHAAMLKTRGTAWDVAEAVAFLASESASWITGVTLPVDAGSTAMLPLGMYRPGAANTAEVSPGSSQ